MRMTLKTVTDMLMGILLLLLMADRHTGNAVHEGLGVALAVAFLLHAWLNRAWYKTLARGRYNLARMTRLALNGLLLLAFMGTLASALPISRTVFSLSGFRGELFARAVHVCCAHWCFLLAAAHCGMYGKSLDATPGRRGRFPLPPPRESASWLLYIALAGYGAWVFLSRELMHPLSMNGAFMLWNENERALFLLLDYGALFLLCAWTFRAFSSLSPRQGKGEARFRQRADRLFFMVGRAWGVARLPRVFPFAPAIHSTRRMPGLPTQEVFDEKFPDNAPDSLSVCGVDDPFTDSECDVDPRSGI